MYITTASRPFDIDIMDILVKANNQNFKSEREYKYPIDEYVERRGDNFVYFLELAIPGINRDLIKLERSGNTLSCSYQRDEKEQEVERKYFSRHITRKSFNFQWRLSDKLDITKLSTKYENGLLTIEIPYKEEEQPQRIEIA